MDANSLARRILARLSGQPYMTPELIELCEKYGIPPAHFAHDCSYLAIMNVPDGMTVEQIVDEIRPYLTCTKKGYVGVNPDEWVKG